MSTLSEQLDELADRLPRGVAPADLWDRGRRYGRRRRAGTLVVVAVTVLALVSLGSAGWWRARGATAPYAGGAASAPLRLPDHFVDPSGWLAGVDDEGPLGPVSAVIEAGRKSVWGRSVPDLVGVSAGTGEYRFLDLPGFAPGPYPSAVALSADGTRLAYFYDDGTHPGPGDLGEVGYAGVAVYDLGSGEVVARREVPSSFGVLPSGLLWVGDRVWLAWCVYDGPDHSAGTCDPGVAWNPTSDQDVPLRRRRGLETTSATAGVAATAGRALSLTRLTPAGVPRTETHRLDAIVTGEPLLSPDRQRVIVLQDRDGRPQTQSDAATRVLVGRVPPGPGPVALRAVGTRTTMQVLGWRDPQHVVADQRVGGRYARVVLDLRDGSTEPLGPPSTTQTSVTVAQEAWAAPVFVAPDPPSPLDPRVTAALVLGILGLAAGALVWWRRRVRP